MVEFDKNTTECWWHELHGRRILRPFTSQASNFQGFIYDILSKNVTCLKFAVG